MEKVSKEQVEEAVCTVKELKIKAAELNGTSEGRGGGRRGLRARPHGRFFGRPAGPRSGHYRHQGRGRPNRSRKASRSRPRPVRNLAAALPPAYVKVACDFGVLYDSQDKVVRQILKARGIEIVREDKFAVI